MLTDPYIPSRPDTFIVLYGISSEVLNSSSLPIIANSSQTYSTQLNTLQLGKVYYYKITSKNMFATREIKKMSFVTNEESKFISIVYRKYTFTHSILLVSSAVTNLIVDSMGNNATLVISWELPATPNGNITSYSVSIINLKDGSAVRQENTITTTITQTNLGNITFSSKRILSFHYRTWSSLQCEYCSSEQGRSRRVQCVYLLHKRIRYNIYYVNA